MEDNGIEYLGRRTIIIFLLIWGITLYQGRDVVTTSIDCSEVKNMKGAGFLKVTREISMGGRAAVVARLSDCFL